MLINLITDDIEEREYLLNKLKSEKLNIKNEQELEFVADILATYIIEKKENEIIIKIINREYFYFSKEEKEIIKNKCTEILRSENIKETSKKELLKLLLIEYIKENEKLNIKGFINFRMKSYIEILEYVVEIAIEKFVLEKEYIELIKVLKGYVQTESSKIKLLHIIYDGNKLSLLNNRFEELNIHGKVKYLSDFGIINNNNILNILLDIIPQKIIIHNKSLKEDTFLATIENIFSDRIEVCEKCKKNAEEKIYKYCFLNK